MNADESQTPKPKVESSEEPKKQSSTPEPVQNSAVNEEQNTTSKPVANSGSDTEYNPTLESVSHSKNNADALEDSNVDFLVELEDQIAQTESETESELAQRVAELQRTEQALKQEIASLQASRQALSQQLTETQTSMGRLVQEALTQLEQRKQTLQIAVEQLERRQERIRTEMRTTFAGTSQELAIRVQGFKDYLAGSLQDLAAAAEQLELVPKAKEELSKPDVIIQSPQPTAAPPTTPQFAEQRFQSTTKQIRRLLDQYRNKPDYYGPTWQLRRTFEPVHAERVSDWFFKQGGRGALRTMGSRLQNILISSAVISVLYSLYEDSLRTLVLANTPERLGDWRRGLQDCLGIARGDFGPEHGVVLFETPEAVALKAERVIKDNEMPLIIIDDSEDKIDLSLLQFPLWLAFAPDPRTLRDRDYDYF